ncbi:PACE efflux transporter [Vibrio sp.]|uniref:PACE efflux transporter n=1 Tax=Vibrio sp. TaxID=678 RepID=UPI003D0C23DC
MTTENNQHAWMRSPFDRMRHAVLFELFLLFITIPLAMWVFDRDIVAIGFLAVVITLFTVGWNTLFNYLFDKVHYQLYSHTVKEFRARLLHSLLFELGLLIGAVPFLAWQLDMTLWQALIADIGFVLVALCYAFVFNLSYDKLFPLPGETGRLAHSK